MSISADVGIFVVSIAAGVIGALGGVGGGILIIPALTVIFGVDIHHASGAAVVAVIATSSGAAAAYVRDRLTNMRIGMFLELATTSGAVIGALLSAVVPTQFLFFLLGAVLFLSGGQQLRRLHEELPPEGEPGGLAARMGLASSYPDARLGREVEYQARRVPLGFVMMGGAGLVSGLLGTGAGPLKVLAMDGAMRLPMKVSSTTSNFMIGVTAAASAGIYIGRGLVNASIAAPVALGVLIGALSGARLLVRMSNSGVRRVFIPVLLVIALEMVLRGFGVGV